MMKKLKEIIYSPLLLLWVTMLNHIVVTGVSYRELTNYTIQSISMIVILSVLAISMYVCSVTSFKTMTLKFSLYFSLFLLNWQLVLNVYTTSTISLLADFLTPLILYLITYSAIAIILFGKQDVAKELFVVYFSVILLSELGFLVSPHYFVVLNIFCSYFTPILPLVLVLLYRRELQGLLQVQKRNLLLLTIWNILFFVFLYGKGDSSFALIPWYLGTFLMLSFFHLKIIYKKNHQKIANLKTQYIILGIRSFIGVGLLLFLLIFLLKLEIKTTYILLNVAILVIAFVLIQFFQVFQREFSIQNSAYFRVLFLKRNSMVRELLEDESYKNQFSEFLHNEVLQSVIAIKNFNKQGSHPEFRNQIEEISQSMILQIREQLDIYQPYVDRKQDIIPFYRTMIQKVTMKSKKGHQISFQVDDSLQLLPPYDLIVYRFLEELANNSIKYSTLNVSELRLWVEHEIIHITLENGSDSSRNGVGYGLKFIRQRTLVLDGDVEISDKDGVFRVSISIPIDRELCYENFID